MNSKISDFAKNSPLEAWFEKGTILSSKHIIEHESDILRILALWKYGGTYFDLDVVVKKPFSSIGSNFACIEEGGQINSAVLNLDSKLGKSIAEKNFEEVIKHFNGLSWTGNGPTILTRIVKEMCNTTNPAEMTREKCDGFRVLPTQDCYAIPHPSWRSFFNEKEVTRVEEATKDSFAIHFWNKLSHGANLSTNSGAPYIKIAEKYCPLVLQASGKSFWFVSAKKDVPRVILKFITQKLSTTISGSQAMPFEHNFVSKIKLSCKHESEIVPINKRVGVFCDFKLNQNRDVDCDCTDHLKRLSLWKSSRWVWLWRTLLLSRDKWAYLLERFCDQQKSRVLHGLIYSTHLESQA